jgi:hypothetical protein
MGRGPFLRVTRHDGQSTRVHVAFLPPQVLADPVGRQYPTPVSAIPCVIVHVRPDVCVSGPNTRVGARERMDERGRTDDHSA